MKKIFKHLKIVFIAMVLLCSCSGFNFMASASFSDPQPLPKSKSSINDVSHFKQKTITIGKDEKEFQKLSAYDTCYRYEVDSQNPYYASYDGAVYTKDYTKLLWVDENRISIQFHPNLQIIGEGAFGNYTRVKRLVIPWGVTTMEGNNFWLHTDDVIIPDTLINISTDVISKYTRYFYLVASENNKQVQKTLDTNPEVIRGESPVSYTPAYHIEGDEIPWNFYDCYGITPNSLKTFQNGKTYYFDQNCKMAKGWKQASGNWYYFNDYGAAVVKIWLKSGGKWYFMQADGTMATNKWIQWYNKWYYVGSDGAMYANCYTPDGYWVNGSGVWVK